jgi:serine/threonine protein kinase
MRSQPSVDCCSLEQLSNLLDGQLGQFDSDLALAHIERCEVCRKSLEDLSGDASDWKEAREILSSSHELDANPVDDWNQSLSKRLLTPSSHPEMLGRIGRYDIESMIGAGGMGIVYRGFDTQLHRVVAIKVLSPTLAFHGSARQRFNKEARAAAAVVHEDVVPIYDVQTEREIPFIVMRFIPGESLQAKIDRHGALELKQILRIGKQLMAGLAAAHAQGLIHRDVKPANVILEEGIDRALLTDFGLAQTIDDARVTASGIMPGTPPYMSPEQSRGEKLTEQSDVFSAGSVLYAMCTGRTPFRAQSPWKVLKLVEESQPKPIRELNPEIPQWLSAIIDKMMAKSPSDRYLRAAEVSRLFEQCLAHVQQPLNVQLPSELIHSDRSRIKRNRPVRLALGLAVCIFGVLGPVAGVAVYQGKSSMFTPSQSSTPKLVSPTGSWIQVDPLPAPPEESLLQQLSEPVAVDLKDVSLSVAIARILGEIPFELETNLNDSIQRIFVSGSGSRSGLLTRILTSQELGYIVHADRVEIASRESVEARPVVRSYCLSHVTQNDQQAFELVDTARKLLKPSQDDQPELTLDRSVLMVKGTEAEHERLIAFLVAWKDRVRR